jgi:hypothetical protein
MDTFFASDDILEYISSRVRFYDYHKLKEVSQKFNRIFNINSKKYSIKYYESMIIEVLPQDILDNIETRILNKYQFNECRLISRFLLRDLEMYKYRSPPPGEEYCYVSIHYNLIITLKCGKFVEYLIELLYNSEYNRHRNIVGLFDKISNNITSNSIKNYSTQDGISEVIKLCYKIRTILSRFNYKFSKSYKYKIYNMNINTYIIMLNKALYNSKSINSELNRENIKSLVKPDSVYNYKNHILTILKEKAVNNTGDVLKIPKYYIKCILNIVENSYIH